MLHGVLIKANKIPQDGCYIADLKFCLIGGEHLLEGGCLIVGEGVLI